jgi:putative transposase
MSQACSLSVKNPYGLALVCRIWRISRSTYYEQSRHDRNSPSNCKRRGPKGPLSDSMLTEEIRAVIQGSRFHSEGYRKVWARLRFRKICTSKRRVLRLMRENDPSPCFAKVTPEVPRLMTERSSRVGSTRYGVRI